MLIQDEPDQAVCVGKGNKTIPTDRSTRFHWFVSFFIAYFSRRRINVHISYRFRVTHSESKTSEWYKTYHSLKQQKRLLNDGVNWCGCANSINKTPTKNDPHPAAVSHFHRNRVRFPEANCRNQFFKSFIRIHLLLRPRTADVYVDGGSCWSSFWPLWNAFHSWSPPPQLASLSFSWMSHEAGT